MARTRLLPPILILVTLLAGCSAVPCLAPTPTLTPEPTPSPTPTPAPDFAVLVLDVEATWQEVDSLARWHMEEDMTCESCHIFGLEVEDDPENAVCIDCHGGTIEAVRILTNEDGEEVHPFGHLINVQCSSCHRPHEELDDPCSLCH